jgi:nitrogenase-stabilizing/protective protein
MSFAECMRELSSAEDFFGFLDVPFDQRAVNVHRLHILQRFQAHLRGVPWDDLTTDEARRLVARQCLAVAYREVVERPARLAAPPAGRFAFVPLTAVAGRS